MEYDIVLHFSREKFLIEKEKSQNKIIIKGKQKAWYIDPISFNKNDIDSDDLSIDFIEETNITEPYIL